MQGIELLPTNSQIVIRVLISTFPGTILAGGALRDLNAGLGPSSIKDLDFFVPFYTSYLDVQDLMVDDFGYRITNSVAASVWIGADTTIDSSVCFEKDGDQTVNIIWMSQGNTPIDRLSRFDFGACQIAYDGRDYHTTTAFHTDIADRTFTLVRSDSVEQFDRSIKRYLRFKERFIGWGLRDPHDFVGQYSPPFVDALPSAFAI
ncbi:hypothetical protein ACVIRO_001273 [Rhizobium ruizarguesonis]